MKIAKMNCLGASPLYSVGAESTTQGFYYCRNPLRFEPPAGMGLALQLTDDNGQVTKYPCRLTVLTPW